MPGGNVVAFHDITPQIEQHRAGAERTIRRLLTAGVEVQLPVADASEQRKMRQKYADVKKRLEAAVKKGAISRKDADAKLAELKKEWFGKSSATATRRR